MKAHVDEDERWRREQTEKYSSGLGGGMARVLIVGCGCRGRSLVLGAGGRGGPCRAGYLARRGAGGRHRGRRRRGRGGRPRPPRHAAAAAGGRDRGLLADGHGRGRRRWPPCTATGWRACWPSWWTAGCAGSCTRRRAAWTPHCSPAGPSWCAPPGAANSMPVAVIDAAPADHDAWLAAPRPPRSGACWPASAGARPRRRGAPGEALLHERVGQVLDQAREPRRAAGRCPAGAVRPVAWAIHWIGSSSASQPRSCACGRHRSSRESEQRRDGYP